MLALSNVKVNDDEPAVFTYLDSTTNDCLDYTILTFNEYDKQLQNNRES